MAPASSPALRQTDLHTAALRLVAERVEDAGRVDRLVERAFGPGRFAKTAERVREAGRLRLDLSVCAWTGEGLMGAVRFWDVRIGEAPALFLGPIAVERTARRRGLGGDMVEHACALACESGGSVVVLVGERAFFEPLGFAAVPPGRVTLPGPIDPKRVFWRALRPGALDSLSGALAAPPSA